MRRGNGEIKGVWRESKRGMERGKLCIGVWMRENERVITCYIYIIKHDFSCIIKHK